MRKYHYNYHDCDASGLKVLGTSLNMHYDPDNANERPTPKY